MSSASVAGRPGRSATNGLDLLAEPRRPGRRPRRPRRRRVRVEDVLDLARVDVVAAADDQVLLAVDDEEEAVLVDVAEVAGVEPAVGDRLGGGLAGGRGSRVITLTPRTTSSPTCSPARRQRAVLRVPDLDLDAADRLADAVDPPFLGAQVERRGRRGLGQAVALEDHDAEGALELVDHLGGDRRAAGDARRAATRGRRSRGPGWLSSAMYIVGTPSNTVTRSRWITSSTVPASNRGTSDIVAREPDADVEDARQPEDVEQRQHHEDDVVVPDAEQPAGGVGVHEELEVGQLGALRAGRWSRRCRRSPRCRRGRSGAAAARPADRRREQLLERPPDRGRRAARACRATNRSATPASAAPLAASSTDAGPGDEHPRAAVAQDVAHLPRLEQHVHRHDDAAGLEDAEVGDHELRHVGQLQARRCRPARSPRASRPARTGRRRRPARRSSRCRRRRGSAGLSGDAGRPRAGSSARFRLIGSSHLQVAGPRYRRRGRARPTPRAECGFLPHRGRTPASAS